MAFRTVDEYIQKDPQWEEEIERLRAMILSTGLEETIKWGGPAYTFKGKNVVGIGAFKNHCALWFFQGALLEENTALLENAQEGKTKAMRQIRFTKEQEIDEEKLRPYILEAKRNRELGKEIKPVKNKKFDIPVQLHEALEKDEKLNAAFKGLTPGRQREYCEYIASAKQEVTKSNRLKKISPMILEKKGLHDRYR